MMAGTENLEHGDNEGNRSGSRGGTCSGCTNGECGKRV